MRPDPQRVALMLASGLSSQLALYRFPSLALHDAGRAIFESRLVRHVHAASWTAWSEVNRAHELLLARATDLTVDENHFRSFRDLGLLKKIVCLERVNIVFARMLPEVNARY